MAKAARLGHNVAAIVLAAGLSTRMGRQKLLLPWGKETVIEHIIGIIFEAGLDPIVVVTGKKDSQLDVVLKHAHITQIVNSDYSNGSMVTSLQKGLAAIQGKETNAMMIFLGDQPTVQKNTIRSIVKTYKKSSAKIVVPSFQFHQGHPWLIDRKLWCEIQGLTSENTMKNFLSQHEKTIQYVVVDTPTVLQDMDTPEDFHKIKPE
jgi:molybdenum cofactor cytidylyltransferase